MAWGLIDRQRSQLEILPRRPNQVDDRLAEIVGEIKQLGPP
jgi:hypothetical protein